MKLRDGMRVTIGPTKSDVFGASELTGKTGTIIKYRNNATTQYCSIVKLDTGPSPAWVKNSRLFPELVEILLP